MKLDKAGQPLRKPKASRIEREFDPSKYSTRLIALKFAYLGQNYNGFEYHANNTTPLPTIEETIWKALMKARLLFPTPSPTIAKGEPNFEGCEYSKCGRTDKGVSAFGQVIGIRVRSNRPLSRSPTPFGAEGSGVLRQDGGADVQQMEKVSLSLREVDIADDLPSPASGISLNDETPSFHPIHDEIPYCQVLNRLLPADIRILAWCPAPPFDFSARFSCKERRYTYFFTQPAYAPSPNSGSCSQSAENSQNKDGFLDIRQMQAAARKFEGLHDFRNFCKVDANKQIVNFERRIFHADVTELSGRNLPAACITGLDLKPREGDSDHPAGSGSEGIDSNRPKLYAFNVHGSAFLWHQIRHMVAILFLVGQGIESPSLVDLLLDVTKTPSRPQYEMADDAPLVLWDCIFPREGGALDPETGRVQDAMEWLYVGDGVRPESGHASGTSKIDGRFGQGGIIDNLWTVWRRRKMDEVLAGTLLNVVLRQGAGYQAEDTGAAATNDISHSQTATTRRKTTSQKVFQGANGPKYAGKYVSVMQKPRMERTEVINERYRERKGLETREEVKDVGMRSFVHEREATDET